jgi:hypothetical protein
LGAGVRPVAVEMYESAMLRQDSGELRLRMNKFVLRFSDIADFTQTQVTNAKVKFRPSFLGPARNEPQYIFWRCHKMKFRSTAPSLDVRPCLWRWGRGSVLSRVEYHQSSSMQPKAGQSGMSMLIFLVELFDFFCDIGVG